jgi:hypothetical protein
VSRPHGPSSHEPSRHVDIGTPPNKEHRPVQNDLGATAINGYQYGPYSDHAHGH